MRVTQGSDRDAAAQIEITFAGQVVEVTTRSVAEHDIKAAIARDDVLEQSLNSGNLIADDRRWRGNNIFHVRIERNGGIFSRSARGGKRNVALFPLAHGQFTNRFGRLAGGVKSANGVALMFGVHGAEKVAGFVLGLFLPAA